MQHLILSKRPRLDGQDCDHENKENVITSFQMHHIMLKENNAKNFTTVPAIGEKGHNPFIL